MRNRHIGLVAFAVCALLVALAQLAVAGPQVIWGPVLGDLTPTSVRISWRSNVPTQGQVLMEGLEQTPTPLDLYHEAQLLNLVPGENYSYTIQVEAEGLSVTKGPFTFTTPEQDLDRFSFIVYGDTRSRADAHRQVIAAIIHTPREFVLHTGDIVADGNDIQGWHKFFGVAGSLPARVPMYTVLGNHERNALLYYQMLPVPRGGGDYDKRWYSFTYGNCFFLALDSNGRLDEQVQWAQEQLAAVPAHINWRFAFFHHPPYGSTRGLNQTMIDKFVPVLEAGGVAMVFGGHDHVYERSYHNGTMYIISGGGGAPLYSPNQHPNPYQQFARSTLHFCLIEVTPERLVLRAIDPDGVEFDTATIEHR